MACGSACGWSVESNTGGAKAPGHQEHGHEHEAYEGGRTPRCLPLCRDASVALVMRCRTGSLGYTRHGPAVSDVFDSDRFGARRRRQPENARVDGPG
jgi:hypothetical protein